MPLSGMNVYKPAGSSCYYARFQVAGQRYNHSTKCEDKAAAMRIAKLKRAAVIAGRWEALEQTMGQVGGTGAVAGA